MEHAFEDIEDVNPNESTFISQMCCEAFKFNKSNSPSPDYEIPDKSMCHDWFKTAVRHCIKAVSVPAPTTVTGWLIRKMNDLKAKIFPEYVLTETSPHIKINPYSLTSEECRQLLFGLIKDYIENIPKYSKDAAESFWDSSTFTIVYDCLVISIIIFFLAIAYKIIRSIKKRANSFVDHEKQMLAICKRPLETQFWNTKVFKLLQHRQDFSKIEIRMNNAALWNALYSLLKTDPDVVMLKIGTWVQESFKTDPAYNFRRLYVILRKTERYHRIINDILDPLSNSNEETLKLMIEVSMEADENIEDNSNLEAVSESPGVVVPKRRSSRRCRYRMVLYKPSLQTMMENLSFTSVQFFSSFKE